MTALGLDDETRGDDLPSVSADNTGSTVGEFDGRLVKYGRSTRPVEPWGVPWSLQFGRVGPRVIVPGATLQEELLIRTDRVMVAQTGRSPSSLVSQVVGVGPVDVPDGLAPFEEFQGAVEDVWAGGPLLPALPQGRSQYRAVSRRRHSGSVNMSPVDALQTEVEYAKGWLEADRILGTIALCGALPVRWKTTIQLRHSQGYLNDGYWLNAAGWRKLTYLAKQGRGELERYRARRLFTLKKKTHLRRVQRLVLEYMSQGGVPLGVEISLTAQAIAAWMRTGRPDALVWFDEPTPKLVWIEVETEPLKWARQAKRLKFSTLQAKLDRAAGGLNIDIELCLREVGTVTRETFEGRNLTAKAWVAGIAAPGRTPEPSAPEREPLAEFTGGRGRSSDAFKVGLKPRAPQE
ncbi:MAG: hypothetical protein ACYCZN_16150 [Candidatus Dormibacteria bacterium]